MCTSTQRRFQCPLGEHHLPAHVATEPLSHCATAWRWLSLAIIKIDCRFMACIPQWASERFFQSLATLAQPFVDSQGSVQCVVQHVPSFCDSVAPEIYQQTLTVKVACSGCDTCHHLSNCAMKQRLCTFLGVPLECLSSVYALSSHAIWNRRTGHTGFSLIFSSVQ
jgi:hypothetical protein